MCSSIVESLVHNFNSTCSPLKKQTEEDAADDDSTVDSIDDVPSRSNLKTTSQKHAEAQLLEELKSRKKRIKKKRPSTQKDADHDDIIQIDSEPRAATPNLKNLTSPSKRNSATKTREDPIDRVQAFLTEIPSLE